MHPSSNSVAESMPAFIAPRTGYLRYYSVPAPTKHLHLELKQEAQKTAARVEQATAAAATESARFGQNAADPLVVCLLETTEQWMQAAGCMPTEAGAAAPTPTQEVPPPPTTTSSAEAVAAFESPEFSCEASELGFPKGIGRRSTAKAGGSIIQSFVEGSRSGSPRKRRAVVHHHDENGKVGHGRAAVVRTITSSGLERGNDGQRGRRRRRAERCGETTRERKDAPPTSSSLLGSGHNMTTAAATSAEQRRELFYALVDALRNCQLQKAQRSRRDAAAAAAAAGGTASGGEENAGSTEEDKVSDLSEEALHPKPVQQAGVHAGSACSGGGELTAIAKPCGNGGGGMMSASLGVSGDRGGAGLCGEGSTSDLSSVSVRTLYEFGVPELRSASTQTIAKVGQESARASKWHGTARRWLTEFGDC